MMSRVGIVLLIATLAVLPIVFDGDLVGLGTAGLFAGFLIAYLDFHLDRGEGEKAAASKALASSMFLLAVPLAGLAYTISDKNGPLAGAAVACGVGIAALITEALARGKALA